MTTITAGSAVGITLTSPSCDNPVHIEARPSISGPDGVRTTVTNRSAPTGGVKVDQAGIGDRTKLISGKPAEPIVWIGRRTADRTSHPQRKLV